MKWSIPEKIVKLGRAYADEGRVTNITQDLTQQVWHADVLGSQLYKVVLDGTPKEEDVCNCSFWQKNKYCKHTVAVELTLRDQSLNRVLKQNPSLKNTYKTPTLSTLFTDSFSKLQEQATRHFFEDVTPLTMTFVVESVDVSTYHPERAIWAMTLKIALDGGRAYVVKNVGDFLTAFYKQELYEINEKYTASLLRSNFCESDLNVLDELVQIYQGSLLVAGQGVPVKGSLKKRYLMLTPQKLRDLMEQPRYHERLAFMVAKKLYPTLSLMKEKPPLKVQVIPDGEGYTMLLDTEGHHFWEKYNWLLVAGKLYELTFAQQEVYQTMTQLLKRAEKPEVFYGASEISDLFTYVIPQLSLISDIQVAKSVESELVRLPLEPKLEFTLEGKTLKVLPVFQYGETLFYGSGEVKGNDTVQTIVRNQQQEQQVLAVLEHFNYLNRGEQFSKSLPESEALYQFFTRELPLLREVAAVELSDEVSSLYLEAAQHQPKVTVKEEGSWFDVDFDISSIADEDVADLLVSLVEKKPFHQFPNGQLLSLESEGFYQTSEALKQLRHVMTFKEGQVLVPKYKGLQIESALSTVSDVSYSTGFEEMVKNLTQLDSLTDEVPEGLQATLRDYQLTGYRWLKMLSRYQFGGILADDMGLGKTVQTIAYLLSEKEKSHEGPSVVVAPASLIYNWKVECEKFAPSLSVVIVNGTQDERQFILERAKDYDILITSYATLRQDAEHYEKIAINALILDEAQMLKNSGTKTFQAMKKLKTVQRFALSGTPIENNLEELWALFHIVMPGFFPAKAKFNKLSVDEIAQMIQPFILRREKSQVLSDLPEKIESNLYSNLTTEQKTTYLAYLRQMQESVQSMSSADFKKNHLTILSGLTRLRQICCDPRLFLEDYEGGSGKLEQVKDLIVSAKANGRRILLFSQFTGMLSLIEEELDALGIDSFYLRGSTKPKQRMEMVDAFNGGEKDVFLISLKAGGTGLNLTGADTVILYDLWWNPAVEEQAAGRAHRMGQKKVVEVWRLIAEGTIEEKMHKLQNDKRALFDKLMSATTEEQLGKLTETDIREILTIGSETV
ncbi:DEAD/DEAH box helicase [Vagococcus sp. PNs007]|uniref:DEAD/DEAH box helicase n=1 Tax=Vagococcus proximus TaxID=2991417 RepID=A0ABT5X3L0_9ENTE|nr:DEAD/DEAH box helicase [Vagococcus proximus]MDF0480592.1 DEAD/DEAH box helicase [Vagococcus proximus]